MSARILLVDDDREFRNEFKDCFSNYEIIEATSGEEAIRILKRPNEIDLVILDVRLPGINGIETMKSIRDMQNKIKIVISTGFGSKDIIIEALRGQADDYIEKSMPVDKIREVIENMLELENAELYGAQGIKGKIEGVKNFIERNRDKKITLADAANKAALSPKYLSRVFKERTGMRFSDYRLNMKIKSAQEFLGKTGYTIEEISDKIGYQNSESFIRQFKKRTKYTPTQYRKKIK